MIADETLKIMQEYERLERTCEAIEKEWYIEYQRDPNSPKLKLLEGNWREAFDTLKEFRIKHAKDLFAKAENLTNP